MLPHPACHDSPSRRRGRGGAGEKGQWGRGGVVQELARRLGRADKGGRRDWGKREESRDGEEICEIVK